MAEASFSGEDDSKAVLIARLLIAVGDLALEVGRFSDVSGPCRIGGDCMERVLGKSAMLGARSRKIFKSRTME